MPKINPSEYHTHDEMGGEYVIWDQVLECHSAEEQHDFTEWMRGQTVAALPDGMGNLISAIYVCDYERWLRIKSK